MSWKRVASVKSILPLDSIRLIQVSNLREAEEKGIGKDFFVSQWAKEGEPKDDHQSGWFSLTFGENSSLISTETCALSMKKGTS